jgi:hypothetical protein
MVGVWPPKDMFADLSKLSYKKTQAVDVEFAENVEGERL